METVAAEHEITREDLDLLDKIFNNIEVCDKGYVDIEKTKKTLSDDESFPEEKKQLFIETFNGIKESILWTEILDVLKHGIINQNNVEDKIKQVEEDFKVLREEERTIYVHRLSNPQMDKHLDQAERKGLLKMFNRMDPDGDGYVTLTEFRSWMLEFRSTLTSKQTEQLFHKIRSMTKMKTPELEDKGITFMDLAIYYKETELMQLPHMAMVRNMGEKTVAKGRWKDINWEDFNREDSEGNPMLTREKARGESDDKGIVKDFLPGVYHFSKIVDYSDLPPLKPASTVVYNVRWTDGKDGQAGRVDFPAGFDGVIATELATSETLRYYGCSLAESDYQQKVELKSRHVLDDYTYGKDYLQKWVIKSTGGAGMEYHDFAHLDCPLGNIRESGHFIAARWVDEEETVMEITAFKVPERHTVYSPPGTLHSNNYLRGTWRTMLSNEPVHEVKMSRGDEPFHFAMEEEKVQVDRERTAAAGPSPNNKKMSKRSRAKAFFKELRGNN